MGAIYITTPSFGTWERGVGSAGWATRCGRYSGAAARPCSLHRHAARLALRVLGGTWMWRAHARQVHANPNFVAGAVEGSKLAALCKLLPFSA